MPRILVIADDLTGAAEIAGIARRFGLSVQLLRRPAPPPVSCDVVIYDTDSRLLAGAAAGDAAKLTASFASAAAFDVIYKKTDSVLRGQPATEISQVAGVFKRSTTLLLPQNPSRKRTIADGRYRVNGVPLHQTEFAADPHHPAATDDVLGRFRSPDAARCLPVSAALGDGVNVCEAETAADVEAWARRVDARHHLAAGGADFFEAVLRRLVPAKPVPAVVAVRRPVLYVRGTASTGSKATRDALAARGSVLPMPAAVFDSGVSAEPAFGDWVTRIVARLENAGEAMLAIDGPSDRRPGRAEMLQTALATATERVLATTSVKTIACEGGATAAAVCDRLGWQQFAIEAELGSGVVVLRSTPAAPRLIVKPGSYGWPSF